MRALAVACVLVAVEAIALNAYAHHEAIFGPQSSQVLTAPAFVSAQTFGKRFGRNDATGNETTWLVGAGVTPFDALPLSFALTVSASQESGAFDSRRGFENTLLGARYRLDLAPLQRALGSHDDFVMFVAGAELPTNSIDYSAFHGPFGALGALLVSVEWRRWSAIAFGFYSYTGTDDIGSKRGDDLFVGGGISYALVDDEPHRMLSLQLGFSDEYRFPRIVAGVRDEQSGGHEFMLSPTVSWGVGPWQFFALVSAPAVQARNDPTERDLWRVGFGVIRVLADDHAEHAHVHPGGPHVPHAH